MQRWHCPNRHVITHTLRPRLPITTAMLLPILDLHHRRDLLWWALIWTATAGSASALPSSRPPTLTSQTPSPALALRDYRSTGVCQRTSLSETSLGTLGRLASSRSFSSPVTQPLTSRRCSASAPLAEVASTPVGRDDGATPTLTEGVSPHFSRARRGSG
jgi:hypothetical protein